MALAKMTPAEFKMHFSLGNIYLQKHLQPIFNRFRNRLYLHDSIGMGGGRFERPLHAYLQATESMARALLLVPTGRIQNKVSVLRQYCAATSTITIAAIPPRAIRRNGCVFPEVLGTTPFDDSGLRFFCIPAGGSTRIRRKSREGQAQVPWHSKGPR